MMASRAASGESLSESLISGSRLVQERSRKIADDRATVEAGLGRLRADEQGLHAEVTALRAERAERTQELATARERLAALDAALAAEELQELARAHELTLVRHTFDRDRELASRMEQEISEVRRQIASAHERLRGLVQSVLRIQHKVWRAARRSGASHQAGR